LGGNITSGGTKKCNHHDTIWEDCDNQHLHSQQYWAYSAGLTQLGEETNGNLPIALTSPFLNSFVNARQILMVIKQKIILSNDIQENPGPFFENCFKIATEFYKDPNTENYFYLRTCVDQLIANQSQENPILFPDDFLNDEVVDIWRKCELQTRGNQDFDKEFKNSLQTIWQFWFMASFKKESNCPVEKQSKTMGPRRNEQSYENLAEMERMSVLLKNKEMQDCGYYKYGRSVDGRKFFCLEPKCKNSKAKSATGVSRDTLLSHARKYHFIHLNFQKKTGNILKDCLRCQGCSKSFSRKQTLRDHQLKYHPNLVNCAKDEDNVTEADSHSFPHSHNETESSENANYPSTPSLPQPEYVHNIPSDQDFFDDSFVPLPYSQANQQTIHVSDIVDINNILSQF